MPIFHSESGTTIDEIAPGIHRISTPVPVEAMPPLGFSFGRFLIVDEQPLLFHTGPRQLFPLTLAAVSSLIDPASLRWIGFSHFEADECGALNEWLEVAANAEPVCSRLGAMVSVNDVALRPARGMAEGDELALGDKTVRWLDAPHLPHAMECGYLYETRTATLLCGDLFAQPGADLPAVTDEAEAIWAPSEAMRQGFAYAPITNAAALLDKLAATKPKLLACMHGSSFRGDGAALLRRLGAALTNDV